MSQEGNDDAPNGPESTRFTPTSVPAADIIERPDALLVILDVPGAEPDTLDVSLDQRVLSISARTSKTAPQGYTPIYTESRAGTYERKFVVSDGIDGDRIDAVLKDGVLRITLPKQEQSSAKKIAVKLN
jgi:HSP20 family molecular chaperone IbpA